MKNQVALGLALLCAVPACRRRPVNAPDAGEEAAASASALGGSGAARIVDDAAIEAYLRYQQRMVGGRAQVRRLSPDAGERALLEAVRGDADFEVAARRAAGLSEPARDAIEALVSEVLAKRSVARALKYEDTLARMEQLRQALVPERRVGVEKAIAALRLQAASLQSLSEARAHFGDAAVEATLRKEAELTQSWERGLESP